MTFLKVPIRFLTFYLYWSPMTFLKVPIRFLTFFSILSRGYRRIKYTLDISTPVDIVFSYLSFLCI